MKLPEGFQYSQSCLQDFVDCRRRFFLRRVRRLSWPDLQMEPAGELERAAQLGSQFHRLAHQLLVGIPRQRLASGIHDPQLMLWWECFLDFLPGVYAGEQPEDCRLHPEAGYSAPVGCRRVAARYDLVCATPSSILIYDWKTTHLRPNRTAIEDRLQSRVYPYLLVRAGRHLNQGNPLHPEQVVMVYWFAESREPVESFPYSTARFQEDEAYLCEIIETVEQLEPAEFTQTDDESRCVFCSYGTLCGRRAVAPTSPSQKFWEAPLTEPAFDRLGEIEFS